VDVLFFLFFSDIREGDKIDEEAFKALVRDAVVLNMTRVGR